jgi:hypothetical protein
MIKALKALTTEARVKERTRSGKLSDEDIIREYSRDIPSPKPTAAIAPPYVRKKPK